MAKKLSELTKDLNKLNRLVFALATKHKAHLSAWCVANSTISGDVIAFAIGNDEHLKEIPTHTYGKKGYHIND